jgi:uncharacterized OB-fold protein
LLCARCDEFSLPHETRCPHCGSETLDTKEEMQRRAKALGPHLDLLRSALSK